MLGKEHDIDQSAWQVVPYPKNFGACCPTMLRFAAEVFTAALADLSRPEG